MRFNSSGFTKKSDKEAGCLIVEMSYLNNTSQLFLLCGRMPANEKMSNVR